MRPRFLLLAALSPFLGEWRGESVCLTRPGVCHDEIVVYRVRPDSARAGALALDAWKIVQGKEDFMGTLAPCATDGATLTCPMPPQYPAGTWRFTLAGDTLSGGLTMADGTPARRIRVVRAGRAR